jgi:hypothetical protein
MVFICKFVHTGTWFEFFEDVTILYGPHPTGKPVIRLIAGGSPAHTEAQKPKKPGSGRNQNPGTGEGGILIQTLT